MFDMTKKDVIEFIKYFEPNYFKDLEFKFKSNICNKCYGRCIFSLLNILDVFMGC